MAKLTKKDFKELARIIHTYSLPATTTKHKIVIADMDMFIDKLCDFLKESNPNFNRDTFLEAIKVV